MDAHDQPNDLIDTNAAAREIGTHPNTIRRWVFSGKLRGWRLMRRYFVSRAELLGLRKPATVRPNGSPCEKQRPGRKSEQANRERDAWVDQQLREAGIVK